VAQIVTDDMPFLVESLLPGLARAGSEAQRVIRPIVVVRRGRKRRVRRGACWLDLGLHKSRPLVCRSLYKWAGSVSNGSTTESPARNSQPALMKSISWEPTSALRWFTPVLPSRLGCAVCVVDGGTDTDQADDGGADY
jgi:hypothetical protein